MTLAAWTTVWKRRLVFWSGAVGVGAAATLFALGTIDVHRWFGNLVAISPYLPLVVTPVGLAAVVILTRKFFPGSQGSGIPQTIAALEIQQHDSRGAVLSLRIALGKVFLTLTALASGASVGREGPTVQIGASIMHSLGRFAHFDEHDMDRGLILAGGAAGVAAAFNTPLAGIVFAVEEMSRSFEQRTSGTILVTVILAGVTSLAWLGNYSYFGHTPASLGFGTEWSVVFVCGAVGGLFGGAFSRLLIAASEGIPGPLGRWMRDRPAAFAALCGLALAVLGLASGSTIYGTGYDEARRILDGAAILPDAYGVEKIAATLISYVSGIPGGIFSPSLSAGAGLGANIAHLMPYAPWGAAVLLGMVAYFSGVTQAPITAFVIVMEMTDNHTMILPLMTASFVAFAISRLVCPAALYHSLAQGFVRRRTEVSPGSRTIDGNRPGNP